MDFGILGMGAVLDQCPPWIPRDNGMLRKIGEEVERKWGGVEEWREAPRTVSVRLTLS